MNNIENIKNKYERLRPNAWKERGFAVIPSKAILDKRISRDALMVLLILVMHTFRGQKFCFPSTKTIAEEGRMSRRHAVDMIRSLETFGYVKTEVIKGKSNRYYVKLF